MGRYVISDTTVYRVPDVAAVEQLHEELSNDGKFQLVGFSYKTKQIKVKGEVVEEYQVVTAKRVFNEEKDPISTVEIEYEVN
jgi:hypothetical protein